MIAHTPGPWSVSPDGWFVIAGLDMICEMENFGGDEDGNARLIAAAPDMANACREAIAFLTRHYETIYGRGDDIQMAAGATLLERILREALAKAEEKP